MNRNELEAHRITVSAQRFHVIMTMVARVLIAGFVYLSINAIVNGLSEIVLAKPDAISALGEVIKNLNINGILGTFVGILGFSGWLLERKGKQRAIRKLDEFRKEIESDDSDRSSSQLDQNGHTPKP